ncbi:hypothetical protein BDA99DRAFT_538582 [Phascolomyces articulosus]|uniref:DNA polymerase kappa n=1 Tax=Phascolomyces articulosus TaxID=60185 RepID=A0AAD5PD78_9FUNG|nr:hypothetical protein BDA99DRAFT_538582 [Phascolomyces articulosus]
MSDFYEDDNEVQDLLLENELSQEDEFDDELTINELLESLERSSSSATADNDAIPNKNMNNDRSENHENNQETAGESSQTLRSRLGGLAGTKAGMESVDKDRVNQIIYEASKGSAFFENERKKDQALTERIDAMMAKYETIRHLNLSHEEKIVDNMVVKIRELEKERDLSQYICHIDMDAYFASVEELEQPELKDVPFAVGGMAMLSTSNYLARKFGVRSAMPGFIGLKLCPQLKIVKPHYEKYREISNKVRKVFIKYDPNFAPMSLDEAYLNLTNYMDEHNMTAPEVVQKIRDEIFQGTQLTASAGVAANKKLSKICSDMNKPNGQYDLANDREAIHTFIRKMGIRKIPGIGRVTERVLAALGVETCGDVYQQRAILYRLLSPISFKSILQSYLGMGSTTVKASDSQKSMSVERTFPAISTREELFNKVDELAILLEKDLAKKQYRGKTVGIKVKLTSFDVRVRAKTLPYSVYRAPDIAKAAKELIAKEMPLSLRLMGVKLSSLESKNNNTLPSVTKFFSPVDKTKEIPAKRPADDTTDLKIDNEQQMMVDDANNNSSINEDTTTAMDIPNKKQKQELDEEDEERIQEQEEEQERQPDEIESVTCPICNRLLNLDNAAFNQHVDECLSRAEVRAILQAESQRRKREAQEQHQQAERSREKGTGKSLLDYYSRPSSSSP